MTIRVLSQPDIQALLDPAELLAALESGFMALSDGSLVAPGRNEVRLPGAGFLFAMPAGLPGHALTVKLVTAFEGNAANGLPTAQAVVVMFDPLTGTPIALLDGTYITAMRTAGGAALSTRLLARTDASVLAIIGGGVQAGAHLEVVSTVRNFTEIRIASRTRTAASDLASLHPKARAVATNEEAARGADVVCLCTNASAPVIEAEWLAPGAHVTSVGYAPPGGELPRSVVERARVFVESRCAFEAPPVGCAELAGLDPSQGIELGELLRTGKGGRDSPDLLTVYKSTGHAAEDLVTAALVYRKALEAGLGQTISL